MWVRDMLTHLYTPHAHHRGQVATVAPRLGAPYPEMDDVLYRRARERLLNEFRVGSNPPIGE